LALDARMPRVFLVDDHVSIVEMMRGVVESLPGFSVAGQAHSAGQAIARCAATRPDIVILDLALGSDSGLDLIAELRAVWPALRIIIFSGILRATSIKRALAAGAHGLLEKNASLDEFHSALTSVAAGEVYFSRFASETIRTMVHARASARPKAVRLTERDKTILAAIGEGLSSKQISARLGITSHAVINYRARLMKKTGVRGVAQLVRFAVGQGLASDQVEGAAEVLS
jgi:two-component system response regulator DevR